MKLESVLSSTGLFNRLSGYEYSTWDGNQWGSSGYYQGTFVFEYFHGWFTMCTSRSGTPAQGLQLQLMSELCKLPHTVLVVITSSLPATVAALLLSTQPKVEIKWSALHLWVSSSHICRRLGPDKNPHVLSDFWVCVCEVGHTRKVAQSICVPHISHLTVWMKHSRIRVCLPSAISPSH